jgi:hypothetical protein
MKTQFSTAIGDPDNPAKPISGTLAVERGAAGQNDLMVKA